MYVAVKAGYCVMSEWERFNQANHTRVQVQDSSTSRVFVS